MTEHETYIYLLKCALNSQEPRLSQPLNTDRLLRFAARHSVAVSIAKLLLDNHLLPDENRRQYWAELLHKNIRKTTTFDAERRKIESGLEALKIWYAPLKGIVVNHLYPHYGMREFADNDILTQDGRQREIARMMYSLGYRSEDKSTEVHCTFMKEPVLNFEIHHRLFQDEKRLDAINDYYKNVKERLFPSENSSFAYHFSDDDFYVYLIAHAYKHFTGSGFGLRQFADIYLYLLKKPVNSAYVEQELARLNILPFARLLQSVSLKMFSPDSKFCEADLTPEETALYQAAVNSGVYGTTQQYYETKMTDYLAKSGKKSKASYYKQRIFPDIEDYKDRNPFLYRHKLLHPWFYIYRPFHSLIVNRKQMLLEIKTVSKFKNKK